MQALAPFTAVSFSTDRVARAATFEDAVVDAARFARLDDLPATVSSGSARWTVWGDGTVDALHAGAAALEALVTA